jgi:hypothetical protein
MGEIKMTKTELQDKIVSNIMVPFEVTGDHIDELVCSAVEGGSGYWMAIDTETPEWSERPKGTPISEWMFEILMDGKSVHLYDREDPEERWELTVYKLALGIQRHIAKNPNQIDRYTWDAETADGAFQMALFGEYVYG